MPTDAIGIEGYDGDLTTVFNYSGTTPKYINVDSSMQGKTIYMKGVMGGHINIIAIKSDGTTETIESFSTIYNNSKKEIDGRYILPETITRIQFVGATTSGRISLYEISPVTE